jgi:O-antigen/teichoic acid export membrane protein
MISVVDVASKVTALILVVAFVVGFRLDVAGAIWADTIIHVGTAIAMIVLLKRVGVWGRPSIDWPLARATTRFALPAHAGTIASYLNYRVDQLIIAAWLPPEQLAFYVIAAGLAERIWVPTGAVATALLPHLTNMGKRDPALSAMIARHVMLWTGAACVCVLVFADLIVELLFSNAYAGAVAPLRWLLPGIVTLSVGKILVAEMFAREKVRYTVWASGIAAFVNVAGNLVLVPRMGITGSAIASSFSYSLLAFIGTWYFLRETRLPWSVLLPRASDFTIYATFWTRGRRVPASEAA